jgi:predicted enzyme related to lactoylglutathione lyase
MPSTVQPVLVTAALDRLKAFYVELLGAEETSRVPEEGAVFYQGLRIGESDVGLVVNVGAAEGPGGRILLSVAVDDVGVLLPRIEELGGRVTGGPNDMPWGQRVVHLQDPDGNPVNLTQDI